jgi:hypothetical protein
MLIFFKIKNYLDFILKNLNFIFFLNFYFKQILFLNITPVT